ncbi:dioxygenase domain-containing protein [Sarocladium implicatum]|nr:dioxygenase domain-containing protein [Sarocladium implicatum]
MGSKPAPSLACNEAWTEDVIGAMGPNTDPRTRQIFTSMIKHLHDFARENQITVAEWSKAVEMINWSGQMSNDRRNETQLMCDILGLESLVDEIDASKLVGADYTATKTAILGPFYRKDVPPTPTDTSIIRTMPSDGEVVYMHGKVTDASNGKPIAGAKVDVWQCSTNGLYEQQDPEQADFNLRGLLTTDENGYYGLYCLRPVPYPIPHDGPAGKILEALDRHSWRPAHIHLLVGTQTHAPLVTQIFDKESKYLLDDTVFAVKDGLTVDFKPIKGNEKATLELTYDIKLAPKKD